VKWLYKKLANGIVDLIDSSIEAKVNHIIKHRFAILTKEEKIAFTHSLNSDSKAFFKFIDEINVTELEPKFAFRSNIDTYEYSDVKLEGNSAFKDLQNVCNNFRDDLEFDEAGIKYCVSLDIAVRGEYLGKRVYKSFDIIKNGKYSIQNMDKYTKKFAFQMDEICPERLI